MTTHVTRNHFKSSGEQHVLCDPCRFNGKTSAAIKYCSDCCGHLCQHCANTHMRITSTKHHRVTLIASKCLLNDDVTESLTTSQGRGASTQSNKGNEMICDDHDNPVVSYCIVHEDLCCRVCIGTTHRECKLQLLSEAASGTRNARELRHIEAGIKRLQTWFEDAQKEKQSNLHHLANQNDTFSNAVKNYRRTMNTIMDKLEQTLLKRKERHYEAKVGELTDCVTTCQQAIDVLGESLNKLDIAAKNSDEQQLFLTLKNVQAICRRYEEVYSHDVDKLPKHYAFHFQPEISIEKFLKGVSELGQIKEETCASSGPPHSVLKTKEKKKVRIPDAGVIPASKVAPGDTGEREVRSPRKPVTTSTLYKVSSADQTGREIPSPRKPAITSASLKVSSADPVDMDILSPRKQAMTSPRQLMSIEELNVRIQSDRKTCSITGTAYLPDDKIVVADATNKKIKVFGADLRMYTFIETPTAPRDVTAVSTTEMACTLPNDRCIQILQLSHKELLVKRTFKLEVECFGITYHNQEFFITSGWSPDREVQVVDMEGVIRRKVRLKPGVLKCPLYATVDTRFGHVYISDYENGVVGIDLTGKLIYRYHDSITKGYMGICSSPLGEVFVCKLQPNGISRVHSENKGSLMSPKEPELEPLISLPNKGGQRPRSIAFSKKTHKILISFVGQCVDVLNIYHM